MRLLPLVGVFSALLCGVLAPPASTARVIYVDPAGSDSGDGDAARPVRSIGRAQDLAAAGDTVLVAPGTYSPVSLSRPGVVYRSAQRYGATIAQSPQGSGSAVSVSGEGITVSGFDITGGRVAVAVTAPRVTIQGNRVHGVCKFDPGGSGGAAIDVFTGNYGPLSDVVVDGNLVYDVGRGPGMSQTVQGIYIAVPVPGGRVTNNAVWAVEDYGIHAYHNPADWLVANNTVVRNGRGILAGPRFRVVNNISAYNRGPGYDVTSSGESGPVTFDRNLSFGNGRDGARAGVDVADPRLVSDSDLHPRADSPAIGQPS